MYMGASSVRVEPTSTTGCMQIVRNHDNGNIRQAWLVVKQWIKFIINVVLQSIVMFAGGFTLV
jgi:hypothetical protein